MDGEWLKQELEAGRSIESIAREVGLDASSVAYWVHKHGLISKHADRHRARGGISREVLGALVARNLTVRQMAAETGRSYTTVRYWLAQHGLTTTAEARRRAPRGDPRRGVCAIHGDVDLVPHQGELVCARCRADRVSAWRRRAKRILVDEAGGRCVVCGYDRCISALHFHHVDPSQKRFGLGSRGLAQAIERLRAEASKCVLVCANCHAEVEAGLVTVPLKAPAPTGVAHLPG